MIRSAFRKDLGRVDTDDSCLESTPGRRSRHRFVFPGHRIFQTADSIGHDSAIVAKDRDFWSAKNSSESAIGTDQANSGDARVCSGMMDKKSIVRVPLVMPAPVTALQSKSQ